MFERPYLQVLKKRMQEPRRFIQVLMGPRQVGKTTLVTQLTKKLNTPYLFVSADAVPASDRSWLAAQWDAVPLRQGAHSAMVKLSITR
jgi:predicted AAA+ superfamily ATPase